MKHYRELGANNKTIFIYYNLDESNILYGPSFTQPIAMTLRKLGDGVLKVYTLNNKGNYIFEGTGSYLK